MLRTLVALAPRLEGSIWLHQGRAIGLPRFALIGPSRGRGAR
jgi:hypothetical protein